MSSTFAKIEKGKPKMFLTKARTSEFPCCDLLFFIHLTGPADLRLVPNCLYVPVLFPPLLHPANLLHSILLLYSTDLTSPSQRVQSNQLNALFFEPYFGNLTVCQAQRWLVKYIPSCILLASPVSNLSRSGLNISALRGAHT